MRERRFLYQDKWLTSSDIPHDFRAAGRVLRFQSRLDRDAYVFHSGNLHICTSRLTAEFEKRGLGMTGISDTSWAFDVIGSTQVTLRSGKTVEMDVCDCFVDALTAPVSEEYRCVLGMTHQRSYLGEAVAVYVRPKMGWDEIRRRYGDPYKFTLSDMDELRECFPEIAGLTNINLIKEVVNIAKRLRMADE